VVGFLADRSAAADQLDDPAIIDHDAALGVLAENGKRILDP
jgi:hypothetical protein